MKQTFSSYEKLDAYRKKHDLIPEKSSIIVGLSGGPDSIFLLYFLAQLRHTASITVTAAHLDHQWRADSAADVALCRAACNTLGINLVVGRASDFAGLVPHNGSKEECGRTMRRLFFEKVGQEHHADIVALGHHADDQDETFFIRLVRGSSLSGLVGMRPRTHRYTRPLLCLRKKEIVSYLDEQKIPYLIDPTNTSNDFLRNRLRTNVLPALKNADPRFLTTFERTLEHLAATETFLDRHTKHLYAYVSRSTDTGDELNITEFITLDPILQQRIIILWLCSYNVSFPARTGFFTELISFLAHERGGSHQIHHAWMIKKKNKRAGIRLTPTGPIKI